jgi:HSF-type DNA-binding
LTFTVKDPVRFETEIIPQFFKHSKFTSFVRVSNGMFCFCALFHVLRLPGVVFGALLGREVHETHATLLGCFNSFCSN